MFSFVLFVSQNRKLTPPPSRMTLRSRESLKYFASTSAHSELNNPHARARSGAERKAGVRNRIVEVVARNEALDVELLFAVVDAEPARQVRPEALGLHGQLVADAEGADHRLRRRVDARHWPMARGSSSEGRQVPKAAAEAGRGPNRHGSARQQIAQDCIQRRSHSAVRLEDGRRGNPPAAASIQVKSPSNQKCSEKR